ncbi:unnamed protein product [Caenorhabditis brenneri]
MANSFSLLRLPNDERLQVLRCMNARDLLLLSLLSRNSKDLVRSLHLRPSSFLIMIGHWRFAFSLPFPNLCLDFYKEPEENMKMLEKPKKVWISVFEGPDFFSRPNKMELPNPLELKDWLNHILYIFNSRQASQIIFSRGYERFDLKAIKEKLGNAGTLCIPSSMGPSRRQTREILEMFLPDIKHLRLISNPFRRGDPSFQKVLTQNFEALSLGFVDGFKRFTLNDLLISNALDIDLGANRNFEGVNQFLKLWINGANPRLQTLNITQRTDWIPEEILKGVEITGRYSMEEDIVHNNKTLFKGNNPGRTAVDIKRFDGTRGTVVVLPNEEQLRVLRCMDPKDLLPLSLTSRKTKDLVKSVKIKFSRVHVKIGHNLSFYISPCFHINFHFNKKKQENTLEKPIQVTISRWSGTRFPNTLEVREWFQHILYISNRCLKISIEICRGWERFDLKTIKAVFGKVNALSFDPVISPSDSRKILSTFVSDLEELRLVWNPYPHGDTRLQKMLIQNFDALDLGSFWYHFEGLHLDQLSVCNARYLNLSSDTKVERVNQFLKLWIRGSNARLRKLFVKQRVNFDLEEILKGIQIIREIPVTEDIVYEGRIMQKYGFAVDIMRCDNTKGTVVAGAQFFCFLVWN